MDQIIGYLFEKLSEAKMLNELNVIIVSDHGMAQITNNYAARDLVDVNLIDVQKSYFGIVSNVYPRTESDVKQFYLDHNTLIKLKFSFSITDSIFV
jgi:predicted AlkP superfamily pyrophosphatase or phosphodiesterase